MKFCKNHHRNIFYTYHVVNDQTYWEKFLSEADQYVLWVDYGQNIALTPKFETQSAHFPGRQHTLHDSLLSTPYSDTFKYIYHLSDETNHESVLSDLILRDIIEKYPQIIDSGHFVLRSDNCSTQYKSRFVFQNLLNIAREINIQVTWFYGEPGHWRGVIDAMAWFGAKGPLRFGGINKDLWFPTAFSMVEYLDIHFMHDSSKHRYIIDPVVAAVIRKKPWKECVIKGCKSAHVIAFHPDGTFSKCNLIDDSEEIRTLNFGGDDISDDENVTNKESEIEDVEEYEDEINDDDEVNIDTSMIFSCIDEASYVAIRSPVGSLDFFFIMKILKKGIASENMSDSANDHFVLEGELYLIAR